MRSLSNLFKSGFPGVQTINTEPFVIDVNSRVIEQPKNKILRSVSEKDKEGQQEEDIFSDGITQMAEEIDPATHKEILDDALEKAKLLQDDARERAQKIIEDAKAEAENIRQTAKDEGYAKGLEDGNMEAMRRADEYLEQMKQERENDLAIARQEMADTIADAENKIVDTACRLIEKLTGIYVHDYKPVMIHMINNVLNDDDESRKFIIRVSEANYSYIADNQDRLSNAANPGISIEVFSDSKLSEGQCQIESDTGIIDLSMDVQVRNLITAIKLLSE